MVAKKNLFKNSEGQAIFELIVFLPFLVYFVTIMVTAGSAINGSINQQKATRGYFYYILKGNSNIPIRNDLNSLNSSGVERVSVFSIGWAESRPSDGEQFGTCYEFSRLYSTTDETCEGKKIEPGKSIFIKPFTMYGLCSATYVRQGNGDYWMDLAESANVNCSLPGG